MSKILLVDDDAGVRTTVNQMLQVDNYLVDLAENAAAAFDQLAVVDYDLLILDWELPDGSGYQICQNYRTRGGKAPVLFLTGQTQVDQKVSAFNAGADDYLTKPFHMKELQVRVRALLRRPSTQIGDKISVGRLAIEPSTFSAYRDGQAITLLPKEFALLDFFLRHPGQVFSADALLARVWSTDAETTQEALRQTLSRLRAKLDVKGQPSFIRTVIGVGYKLDAN
jgi:two-component system, OmpR family, manganese sensing response regulator